MGRAEQNLGEIYRQEANQRVNERINRWKSDQQPDLEIAWPASYYDVILWLEREIHKNQEKIQIYLQSGFENAESGEQEIHIYSLQCEITDFQRALKDLYSEERTGGAKEVFTKLRDKGAAAVNRNAEVTRRRSSRERSSLKLPLLNKKEKQIHIDAYYDSLRYACKFQAAIELIEIGRGGLLKHQSLIFAKSNVEKQIKQLKQCHRPLQTFDIKAPNLTHWIKGR